MMAALAVAIGLALPFAVSTIGGVATWKIVLAAAGGALFVAGSRSRDGQ